MDLYHVLGVTSDASPEEIKRAYHQLAKKYHPDRNKDKDAEDKFKDIAHAYGILSDPVKRKEYNNSGDPNPENDESIIEVDDIIQFDFEIELDYEDFVFGITRSFKVVENIMIDDKGNEVLPIICPICKGKIRIHHGFKMNCKYCQDTGQIYNKECKIGEKLHEFIITIEPRSWIGRVISWNNKRILLTAKELSSGRLRNEGNLLIYSHPITIFHALVGLIKEIKILDQIHKIEHPQIIMSDSHLVIPNAGLYDFKGNRDNLIIEFDILFPKKITDKQRKCLEKCMEIDREAS